LYVGILPTSIYVLLQFKSNGILSVRHFKNTLERNFTLVFIKRRL